MRRQQPQTQQPRPQQQKPKRLTNYEFMPYTGSGTEVVDGLQPGAISAKRLRDVAAWHDHPSRQNRRHKVIAERLRAIAANDNKGAA